MRKWLILAFRIVLGAVFIFSGFVKVVDPWGTAIKMGEYLATMHLGWLGWASMPAAVVMSALEFTIGVALLFGLCRRLTGWAAMFFMAFFTLLTLYSAVFSPVGDCGCFGDAVKLSPWETFFKNLILLPMSIFVWRGGAGAENGTASACEPTPSRVPSSLLEWPRREGGRPQANSARREARSPQPAAAGDAAGSALQIGSLVPRRRCHAGLWVMGAVMAAGCLLGLYALRHLPPIDFLPYRVGTDLRAARESVLGDSYGGGGGLGPGGSGSVGVGGGAGGGTHTTVIYRNRATGREQEFELGDTTWYNDKLWEYVDTRTVNAVPRSGGGTSGATGGGSRAVGGAFNPFRRTDNLPRAAAAADFAVFGPDGEITAQILYNDHPVTLLCVTDPSRLQGRCRQRMARAAAAAEDAGGWVIGVTPSQLSPEATLEFDGRKYDLFNIDGTLLKTMLRARNGAVRIENGVITFKRNCLDL